VGKTELFTVTVTLKLFEIELGEALVLVQACPKAMSTLLVNTADPSTLTRLQGRGWWICDVWWIIMHHSCLQHADQQSHSCTHPADAVSLHVGQGQSLLS